MPAVKKLLQRYIPELAFVKDGAGRNVVILYQKITQYVHVFPVSQAPGSGKRHFGRDIVQQSFTRAVCRKVCLSAD